MTLSAKSHTETNSVEHIYIFRDSKRATRLMHVHNRSVLCIYSIAIFKILSVCTGRILWNKKLHKVTEVTTTRTTLRMHVIFRVYSHVDVSDLRWYYVHCNKFRGRCNGAIAPYLEELFFCVCRLSIILYGFWLHGYDLWIIDDLWKLHDVSVGKYLGWGNRNRYPCAFTRQFTQPNNYGGLLFRRFSFKLCLNSISVQRKLSANIGYAVQTWSSVFCLPIDM